MKRYIISAVIAFFVALGVVWIAPEFIPGAKTIKIEHITETPARSAVFTLNEKNELIPLDFTAVAEEVMPAVVHIKSTRTSGGRPNIPQPYYELPDPFRDFFREDFFFFGPENRFNNPRQPQNQIPEMVIGSGSGVIINSEGYIVTNNHVIAEADDIEVTLHNNRTYKATIIGTDPSTDLALIQIKETNLPSLPFVNSNEVKVGEWVLAVGNPFNLNSTVTAGIVSAKYRNLNILQDKYPIESFIQTDAAINQGNSGGALVNLQGGLIGVNTAIASPTGFYAGYGFAVPSNIVSKVVEDLLEYGIVQRAYLGVIIRRVDGSLLKEKDLEISTGIYVDSVVEKSAAFDAGLKEGDVILEIDGFSVNTVPELQEIIARHRPGDEVSIKYHRNGRERDVKVKLKNTEGEAKFLAKNRNEILNILGAEFEEIDRSTLKKLNIDGGVRLNKLYAGKLMKHTNIREGFIITKVDGKTIKSVEELTNILENKNGGVLLEGVYEDIPGVHYYAFGIEA